ncbi:MAG: lysylphosphatidylglycerol synthase transmembrane domain-containing protein [Clostridiales bacterium]
MQNKLHSILFVVGLIILGFLVRDFGIDNIVINIRKLGWWFLAVVGIWGCVYIVNAWAWYIILGEDRDKISFARIFGISLSGFAINYITPFVNLGGEPYRISALKDSLGLEKSVSLVTLYRMVHILAHLIFWLCIIPLSIFILPNSSYYMIPLLIAFFVILFLTLFFFSRHRRGLFEAILNILLRLPFLKFLGRRLEKHKNSILIIDEQIRDLFVNRKRAFYASLLLEFLTRFLAAFEFLIILVALGIQITFLQAFYIHAASSLFLNIFFFMPLEMGTREVSLFVVFHAFNFNPELSIFVGLVNRSRELFWIVIGVVLIQINNRRIKRVKEDLPQAGNDYGNSNI